MSDSVNDHTTSSQQIVLRTTPKGKRFSGPKFDPAEVYRVALRLPPFWPEEPDIWFAQIEAQFENAGVTNDVTKYNYVVGHLDHQQSKEVKDIIMSPPASNRYEKLKTELVRRLSAFQEWKVKQLLMHEELGDRKPSQFLRHLQEIAGPTVPEDFVRTIWCNRLPNRIQPLLASQPHKTLEELAKLADCVQDIYALASGVAAASAAASAVASAAASAAGPSSSEIVAEIAELKQAVKDLTLQLRESRSLDRSHGRGRDARRRLRHRSSNRSDSSYRQHPVCWYHSMHGEKAKHCIKPCDYRQ